jgi:hypothetical protein
LIKHTFIILLIFLEATSAVAKEFPKIASTRISRFPKGETTKEIREKMVKPALSGHPLIWVLATFRKTFITAQAAAF